MGSSVEHANKVTRTYGVEVMSINIISVRLSRSCVSYASHIYVQGLAHLFHMLCSSVSHASLICFTCFAHLFHKALLIWTLWCDVDQSLFCGKMVLVMVREGLVVEGGRGRPILGGWLAGGGVVRASQAERGLKSVGQMSETQTNKGARHRQQMREMQTNK